MTTGDALLARCTEGIATRLGFREMALLDTQLRTTVQAVWPELWWSTVITEDPADDHRIHVILVEPLQPPK